MIAYVGLDLGINTSVLIDPVAPKLEPQTPLQRREVASERGRHVESASLRISTALDIQLDFD
jgi:hypothetical protein